MARINQNHAVCIFAILRCISGCMGPPPINSEFRCDSDYITEVLDSTDSQSTNVLNVRVGQDSAGRPFQTATLLFGSRQYANEVNGIVFVANDMPQLTTVWNGRLLGIGRPTLATQTQVQQGRCSGENFWEVPVGFGTIAEDRYGSSDPGFSVVGHPLTEGQELRVRLDVCRTQGCSQGITRTFRVHLVS